MKKERCFIYTDLFLDDLCAVQFLGTVYENATVFVTLGDKIAGSDYASDRVQSEKDFFEVCSRFFTGETKPFCEGERVPRNADIILLAPLTDFEKLLQNQPEIAEQNALMMGGIFAGADGALNEWNASADENAYRYTVKTLKNLRQVTRNECLALFAENGYPFDAEFLPEYIEKMKKIGENLTCFDLQAVSIIEKENLF